MACQICKLVGNLKIIQDGAEMQGILSAALNASTDVYKTSEGTILVGPTTGNFSIVAYPYYTVDRKPRGDIPFGVRLLDTDCRGRASVSIEWVRRYDCDTNTIYFIPKKGGRAFIEGEFPSTVLTLENEVVNYNTFQADASSGPSTPYMLTNHVDGFNLQYFGRPIPFESDSVLDLGEIIVREDTPGGEEFLLPEGTQFYLNNFEIAVEPPFTSRVTYNFLFYMKPEGFPC